MSLLSKVVTGKIEKPHFVLFYGEPGIGKSTLGACAPNPIFLCSEDGADEIGVARIKIHDVDELKSAIKELVSEKHDYKSIVVDTVDHFEQLIFAQVAKDEQKPSVEHIGYGKGYGYALEYWIEIVGLLEQARNERGMNIILLAHSVIKAHNDPQLDAGYDRYQIKLHQRSMEYLRDRVSCVLFCTYKTYLDEKDNGKNKAYGDGTRVMYTEHRPSFIAKNRFNLPFELPLSWEDFDRACRSQTPKDASTMIKFIEDHIDQLTPDIRENAKKHFAANRNNPAALAKIESRIKAIISTKTA